MNHTAPIARPHVVVIGGGFSGTALTLHLLRDAPSLPVRITIVEPRPALAEGLAYSTQAPEHRINVAAARMAVFAETPDDFDVWFYESGQAATDPDALMADGSAFPTRAVFAAYVRARLTQALDAAPAATLRHARLRAESVAPLGAGFVVTLSDGERLTADVVVLATGHFSPELPSALLGLAGDSALIADPWAPGALAGIDPTERVAIIGTGLTMADVLASLRAQGNRAPVTAVSRRGLLPRPRTRTPVIPIGQYADPPSRSASALLRRVRTAIDARTAEGRPWEDVFDAVRAQGRAIWATLSPDDRRRLLRHASPYWDVHRYQCSPQIAGLLQSDQVSGALSVVAGRLFTAQRDGGALRLHLRHHGTPATLTCGRIIICIGPGRRGSFAGNPALHSLAKAGLIRPDAYGLGIAVNAEAQALDAHSSPHPALLVAGPPARGTWGELMGLPQVSAQPREVACALAQRLGALNRTVMELPA